MKCVLAVLFSLVVLDSAFGGDKCAVTDGSRIQMNKSPLVRVKAPCKFIAVNQECGDYKLLITPGQRYLNPFYITHSLHISAEKDGKLLTARTDNKKAGWSLISGIAAKPPLARLDDSSPGVQISDVFVISNTSSALIFREKNDQFEIRYSVYDFSGKKQRDSGIEFTCLSSTNKPVPFPQQFCGNGSRMDLKEDTMALWGIKKKNLEFSDYEETMLYRIFDDPKIEQTNEYCKSASENFINTCTSTDLKKKAISECHEILTHQPTTECIGKYSCDPIRIFSACVQFVCSDFKDREACSELGQGLDLCRKVGKTVTDMMKKPSKTGPGCYKELFTSEDNPNLGSK